MKKQWNRPEIESLDIKNTAFFDFFEYFFGHGKGHGKGHGHGHNDPDDNEDPILAS